jgi:hypothetical protein
MRCCNSGISLMSLKVKLVNASARSLDAEITKIFMVGFIRSDQSTNAEVSHDFPSPRNP